MSRGQLTVNVVVGHLMGAAGCAMALTSEPRFHFWCTLAFFVYECRLAHPASSNVTSGEWRSILKTGGLRPHTIHARY
jgi:hypothetical protein